jgi:hypothetical protein
VHLVEILLPHSRARRPMAPAKQGARIVHDDIVVFELMTDPLDRPWWEAYRHGLEQSFAQDEIVIRAVAITRL